jgi:hypothetical protein
MLIKWCKYKQKLSRKLINENNISLFAYLIFSDNQVVCFLSKPAYTHKNIHYQKIAKGVEFYKKELLSIREVEDDLVESAKDVLIAV